MKGVLNTLHQGRLFAGMSDTLIFQMHRIHCTMFKVANGLIKDIAVPVKIEQLPILMCIYNSGNVSQQEVADMVHRDKSSVQRTVVALHKKGLVNITQDGKDKRKNILCTTKAGTLLALQIKDIITGIEEYIFSAFASDDKRNTINAIRETADKLELMSK